jgi:hypothetical protein
MRLRFIINKNEAREREYMKAKRRHAQRREINTLNTRRVD